MIHIRLFILVLFFCAFFTQSSARSNPSLVSDSTKLNLLFNQVKSYISSNKLDSASLILQQTKTLSLGNNDVYGLKRQVKYFKVKFDILFRQAKYEEALKVSNELMQLSLKLKDDELTSEIYFAIANVSSKKGQLSIAAENIVKALKFAEKLGNNSLIVKHSQFLSDIFLELREPKKALYYSEKAYRIAKNTGQKNLIKAKLSLILSEVLASKFELAQQHLKEVEGDINKDTEPFQIAKVYLYLSHLYFEKKEFQLSLQQLKKIPPYYARIDPAVNIKLHTEIAMAESYAELKNFRLARHYFDQHIAEAMQKMDTGDIKICLRMGSKIYEGLGDANIALSYLKQYTIYSDSLSKIVVDKAIHETEIKYQTTLKEKAISEQKLQLINKDFEIQKKNRYLIFGFSALVLLILSALLAYLIYRNRNQSIELSLLKAQIHPHFLFNTLNNLYALSISKSDQAPGVVMGLSSILRYILYECNTVNADLAREINIISAYIDLEKIRYADGLEVNTYFDSDFKGYTIAPLLLLPLVENAYKHGVSKLEKDSWINIEAKIKGNNFVFKISNNKPINKNELLPKTIYGNIGLKNIQKRLDILYPKQHKIKITDTEDVFLVTLELPVKEKA